MLSPILTVPFPDILRLSNLCPVSLAGKRSCPPSSTIIWLPSPSTRYSLRLSHVMPLLFAVNVFWPGIVNTDSGINTVL